MSEADAIASPPRTAGGLGPMTGLYNRQTFDDRMRRVAQNTARQRRAAHGQPRKGAIELF